MKNVTRYTVASTLFEEGEKRLVGQIENAKRQIDEARVKFAALSSELTNRRDVMLEHTAILRNLRAELEHRSQVGRAAILEMTTLVLQCETLTADLVEFLQASLAAVGGLDAEIKTLEDQEKRKTAKPIHQMEKLRRRLAFLKVRRALTEKRPQVEPELMIRIQREPGVVLYVPGDEG